MAQIKFFADECTFGLTVRLLRNRGFNVVRAQELGMAGAADPEIYDKAQELNAVYISSVTRDIQYLTGQAGERSQ